MTEVQQPPIDEQANEQEKGPIQKYVIPFIKQIAFFWMISSVMKQFSGGGKGGLLGNSTGPSMAMANIFMPNEIFDLYCYLDETDQRFANFSLENKLVWKQAGIVYDDWYGGPTNDGTFKFEMVFKTPEVLLRNESLYLHTFIVKTGMSPDPINTNYAQNEIVYRVHKLNLHKKKYYKSTVNLITGKSEQSPEEQEKAKTMEFEILNHWHPNITINLVVDQTKWSNGTRPPPFDEDLKYDDNSLKYEPILYINTWWNLQSDYMPINSTVEELKLVITYQPISLLKYQIYASQAQRKKWESLLGADPNEDDGNDMLKQAILETNPILLGITFAVSILHSIFEFLAFKNDIEFWKERKDLVGLSVRSVLFNIFQSFIVFLYVCDNDTNFIVKVSVGIGLLIEMWKVTKVMDIEIDWDNKVFGVLPRVTLTNKGSYVESDTKVYDDMAFRYLGCVLFPLLIGYTAYSIMYVEQKGWYSWVLNMLYGFLLTFGFITMTPQLFINYKLKSVAHLPWRMLSYKFINTFIDDLFAFVINTPLLYRIGCFRDDIIFLIYLYQRWIYRVDPTRVNEFGTSGEEKKEKTE